MENWERVFIGRFNLVTVHYYYNSTSKQENKIINVWEDNRKRTESVVLTTGLSTYFESENNLNNIAVSPSLSWRIGKTDNGCYSMKNG